ncbi:Cartilage matrix protein [Branchiostoma belcheri]|nr:Cartilage matrix protein [Branchiostoma belcheri]
MGTKRGDNNITNGKKRDKDRTSVNKERHPASYAVLPYIKGVTERLKRAYAKHNVSLFSKPGYTLRNALVSPKDPLLPSEKCGTVYKISCEMCGEVYVGETERSLGERTDEHQKSVDRQDGKSALSQHELKAGHRVTNGPILDIVKIIDQESRKSHRKIKEAVHIQLERAGMNRNEGWELPKSYLPLLRKEAGERKRSFTVYEPFLFSEPPCPNELDIIFVLDGSGSVGSDNFEKIKTFVSKTVARFNIGPTETQFGVIQYNTQPHSEILLNDYQDAASLQQAISGIRYLQGGTNTGKALRYLANNAFSTKNGARAEVSKVTIVVTDGQSADDVVRPALNAGKEGIVLYAVGIGGEVDYQELRDIASSADKVFNVTDFSGLQSIGNTLPDQVCQTGVEVFVQIPITSETFTGELLNPLSVEYTSFSAVIAGWATTTLQSVSGFQSYQIVAIRPSNSGVIVVLRVVTAVYARSVVISTIQTDLQSASLGSFTVDSTGIQTATEGFSTIHATIAYIGTFTAPLLDPTSTAFLSLVQQMEVALFNIFVSVQGLFAIEVLQFNPLPNLIIAHAQFVVQPSALVEVQTTFSSAVSGGLLDTLAVDPFRTTIEDFDAGCFTPLDIAILLDGSDSVSSDDFQSEKSFAKLFLNEFDIGQDNSRVTVFQYGTEPRQERDVQAAIADTEYMGGSRNLGQAVRYMATYGFSSRNGARTSVPSVAIVIAGGASLDDVAAAASKARRSGIILYTIGVGNATVPSELAAIATAVNTSYTAASFAALRDLRTTLADEICTIGTVQIASMDISEDVTDLADSAEYQALKVKVQQDVAEVIGPSGAEQVNVLGLRVLP